MPGKKRAPVALVVDPRTVHMPLSALDCRADGGRHWWSRLSQCLPTGLDGEVRSLFVTRRCERCMSIREDEYAYPSLILMSRITRYSDGYLMSRDDAGIGRITADAARAALLSRIMEGGQ